MKKTFKIYPSAQFLAESFAGDLVGLIKKESRRKSFVTLALSGGNTPKLLFSVMAEKYPGDVDWNAVRIFWIDERCVPPGDPESNYGMTERILLSKIAIPAGNVFRMRGEEDPVAEASRYSELISVNCRIKKRIPSFDIVLLGMGDDGHTASIFPGNENLLSSEKICEASYHPVTGQKRITVTGKVINNSGAIFFLVTGSSKADVADAIFRDYEDSAKFPAYHITSLHGTTTWLLDSDAGKFIC